MSAKVKVTIKDRLMPERELVFSNRTICTVGRAHDCYLQLPCDLLHRAISRHHCLLDIDPPVVLVRDLGSRNGTYVNGKKIGQRRPDVIPETAAVADEPEYALFAGDTVQLGDVSLEVTVCTSDESVNTGGKNPVDTPVQSSKPLSDWNI
jgi:eukaryotic-like serine/threonine-protein kinase